MTKVQYSKIMMYKVVQSVFKVFSAIVEKNSALKELVDSLDSYITVIEELSSTCTTLKKGAAEEKKRVKNELAQETDTICGVLYTFGKKINDTQITAISSTSESDLKSMREPDIQEKAASIYKILLSFQNELVAYGISTESISAYKALIERFNLTLDKRNSKKTASVVARVNLGKTFELTDTLFKENVDKLMKTYRKQNPEFFNQYTQARLIKDLGTRHQPSDQDDKHSDTESAASSSDRTILTH